MKRIERQAYLQKLISFKDKKLIKVITGIRRCGKSTIMEIFRDWLKAHGVMPEQIIYLNLEDYDYYELRDPQKLYAYIKPLILQDKMTYIFFDEIQHVRDFPDIINSLNLKSMVDLYVTGSNAYMLSSEIATLLSGRYVEIAMLPLSFKEYVEGIGGTDDLSQTYMEYVSKSSFPYTLELDTANEISDYLNAVYNTIVEAIALGCNSFSEILSKTQLEKSKLSVYLKNLIEISIVEKESPALASDKEKNSSTKGNYILTDNFFRFWYAFAYRNLTDLENDDIDGVWESNITENLHDFASQPFEKVCLEYLYLLNREKKLPFRIHNASRYWGKTVQTIDGKKQSVNLEIDILAPDTKKKSFIFGECKFRNEAFDMQQFRNLQGKVFVDGAIWFYLFSLSGFTEAVSAYAENHDHVILVTAKDITGVN